MKRDLFTSSGCRKNRILRSTLCSILGITLVLVSLTCIEGSAGLRNQPTLRLLSVGSKMEVGQKATLEVLIAPELFGRDARFGLPMSGSEVVATKPILALHKPAIRLASMDRKDPSRGRTRKS